MQPPDDRELTRSTANALKSAVDQTAKLVANTGHRAASSVKSENVRWWKTVMGH